jgi:hypothetical protein
MMAAQPTLQSRVDLVSLTEADLPEMTDFICRQSASQSESIGSRLHWFLLQNPARREQDPLGFGLRSADQLVGCILLSPQVFQIESNKILLMGSSSFYVDEPHRGAGGRIFMQYSRLARQHPLFGTSANPEAAALWKAAGATPIPNSDRELFGILHWPPIAEEFAHRKFTNRALSALFGSSLSNLPQLSHQLKIDSGSPSDLRPITSAEQVNDLGLHRPAPNLTAQRDPAYMQWRYFSGHDPTAAVFAFRSRHSDREVLVAVNQRTRGYRNQIRTLNILDIYPERALDEWLRIVGALKIKYENAVDAIVLRLLNSERQKAFSKKGFQTRVFDAPTGWILDKSQLVPARDLYMVPADGDGLI